MEAGVSEPLPLPSASAGVSFGDGATSAPTSAHLSRTELSERQSQTRADKTTEGLMNIFKQLFMDQAYKLKQAIEDPAAAKELSACKPIRTLIRKALIKLKREIQGRDRAQFEVSELKKELQEVHTQLEETLQEFERKAQQSSRAEAQLQELGRINSEGAVDAASLSNNDDNGGGREKSSSDAARQREDALRAQLVAATARIQHLEEENRGMKLNNWSPSQVRHMMHVVSPRKTQHAPARGGSFDRSQVVRSRSVSPPPRRGHNHSRTRSSSPTLRSPSRLRGSHSIPHSHSHTRRSYSPPAHEHQYELSPRGRQSHQKLTAYPAQQAVAPTPGSAFSSTAPAAMLRGMGTPAFDFDDEAVDGAVGGHNSRSATTPAGMGVGMGMGMGGSPRGMGTMGTTMASVRSIVNSTGHERELELEQELALEQEEHPREAEGLMHAYAGTVDTMH
jgi:hypothetical protein